MVPPFLPCYGSRTGYLLAETPELGQSSKTPPVMRSSVHSQAQTPLPHPGSCKRGLYLWKRCKELPQHTTNTSRAVHARRPSTGRLQRQALGRQELQAWGQDLGETTARSHLIAALRVGCRRSPSAPGKVGMGCCPHLETSLMPLFSSRDLWALRLPELSGRRWKRAAGNGPQVPEHKPCRAESRFLSQCYPSAPLAGPPAPRTSRTCPTSPITELLPASLQTGLLPEVLLHHRPALGHIRPAQESLMHRSWRGRPEGSALAWTGRAQAIGQHQTAQLSCNQAAPTGRHSSAARGWVPGRAVLHTPGAGLSPRRSCLRPAGCLSGQATQRQVPARRVRRSQ